ncbi:hypothetical protein QUF88_27015 [Bacillus sp. DX1.1]|uniref:hypothetical protein n=1 Tax=unclassified Bacillus (in: firmicutes) TaxID=185979 RepID=UPI0025706290|nr:MULTISPECIES: hypothetical protein [unclassified Bacillus (in: firmicutes)]MDM5157334.1 hypothetical protein [Bacillus sp. DX1.1]WJE84207.1 hypothetical protein QRE67_24555 [Bacillus sp. DX3.1]
MSENQNGVYINPAESISDKLFSQGLCLPSGSSMTVEGQAKVIATVKEELAKHTLSK